MIFNWPVRRIHAIHILFYCDIELFREIMMQTKRKTKSQLPASNMDRQGNRYLHIFLCIRIRIHWLLSLFNFSLEIKYVLEFLFL